MAEWTKHRLEKEFYGHDFGAEMSAGETLSTPTVAVLRQTGGVWVDVTSQFGAPAPTVGTGARSLKASSQVDFTLHAATGTAQDAGDYVVRIEANTSIGRHLTALVRDRRAGTYRLPALEVLEEGDPNAP